MKIPWLLYVGAAAPALPLAAAWGRGSPSRARRWLLGWCAFALLMNLASLVLSRRHLNNHWLNYVSTPLAGGIVLWALSHWQGSALPKATLRVLIPLLWVVWIGMVLLVEKTDTFSLLAEPFVGLVILAGAVYTLTARTFRETQRLLEQDWLWIGIGLSLHWGSNVALPPTANWLMAKNPELVARAYEVKAIVEMASFATMAFGIRCNDSAGPIQRT